LSPSPCVINQPPGNRQAKNESMTTPPSKVKQFATMTTNTSHLLATRTHRQQLRSRSRSRSRSASVSRRSSSEGREEQGSGRAAEESSVGVAGVDCLNTTGSISRSLDSESDRPELLSEQDNILEVIRFTSKHSNDILSDSRIEASRSDNTSTGNDMYSSGELEVGDSSLPVNELTALKPPKSPYNDPSNVSFDTRNIMELPPDQDDNNNTDVQRHAEDNNDNKDEASVVDTDKDNHRDDSEIHLLDEYTEENNDEQALSQMDRINMYNTYVADSDSEEEEEGGQRQIHEEINEDEESSIEDESSVGEYAGLNDDEDKEENSYNDVEVPDATKMVNVSQVTSFSPLKVDNAIETDTSQQNNWNAFGSDDFHQTGSEQPSMVVHREDANDLANSQVTTENDSSVGVDIYFKHDVHDEVTKPSILISNRSFFEGGHHNSLKIQEESQCKTVIGNTSHESEKLSSISSVKSTESRPDVLLSGQTGGSKYSTNIKEQLPPPPPPKLLEKVSSFDKIVSESQGMQYPYSQYLFSNHLVTSSYKPSSPHRVKLF